jgi:anaerobic selenocysteine-containing dehydrogenase
MLSSPSGVIYARSNHEESWQAIRGAGNRINLHIPELLDELEKALCEPPQPDTEFPYILSAGERRSDTANTAVRDTAWNTKGLYGALRVSPQDAAAIGCDSGDTLRLTTRRASADVVVEVSDMMSPGHISLPNGTGIDYRDAEGVIQHRGVAPNEFTDSFSRESTYPPDWRNPPESRQDQPDRPMSSAPRMIIRSWMIAASI